MNKKLLLHICCGPCATATLEELEQIFDGEISGFYYNPNISPEKEMEDRYIEADRYFNERYGDKIKLIKGEYNFKDWYSQVAPLKTTGEGGMRCAICYYFRLKKTFEKAKELGYTHVSTTLSISPHKNLEWIKEIGDALGKEYKIEFIAKKWNYQRSIELSKEYNLYRQNYCGCAFSLMERNERLNKG